MARARTSSDWEVDLAAARAVESEVRELLGSDRRVRDLEDHTGSFERLDFSFAYRRRTITLDVKEKRQPYSAGIRGLWPEVPEPDLFVVDETVFRRVVWQGGGGFLAIHDVPRGRWCYFGPWELTLGARLRYGRWGRRGGGPFLKGKLLVDLRGAAGDTARFDVGELLRVIDTAERWRDRVEPYPIHGATLREIGAPESPRAG
jgi:hypothetical protein